MLLFEKNIADLLQRTGIDFHFDEGNHRLFSANLVIQFQPNLSLNWKPSDGLESQNLIHIWEDIYQVKKLQVESRIQSLLGLNRRIHGRETVVRQLASEAYVNFLNRHHLLGATKAKYRLGLFHKDKLVAVAGFGRECPIDFDGKTYNSSELIRFCNGSGLTVVGGLTKLLNYFVQWKEVEHLMTYVDREWSSGKLFKRIGFEQIAITPPHSFRISPVHGLRYRQAELDQMKTDYSQWPQVANLGNYKFIKIFV